MLGEVHILSRKKNKRNFKYESPNLFENIRSCNGKLTTNLMVFVPSSMTAIRGSLEPSPADIIPPGTNKQERSLRENGTIIQDTVA